MNVLLAGATGAVGRPLTRMLIEAGHTVYALTRSSRRLPFGVRPVVADAMDGPGLLAAVAGLSLDAVVHQLTALKKTPTREGLMAATNALRVEGTKHLLAVARATGARRIVAQSFYGGYGYYEHGPEPLTEQAPFGEGTTFARTVGALKSAEQQIFNADGIEGISLRYGAFYGPGADDASIMALRKRSLPVARGGVAPWTYVDDAASATVAALERGRGGQAYNICDDQAATWEEVLTELARAFGAPKPMRLPGALVRIVAPYAGALMTRTSMRLSTAKAADELGWRPSVDGYRQGIVRALRASRPTPR